MADPPVPPDQLDRQRRYRLAFGSGAPQKVGTSPAGTAVFSANRDVTTPTTPGMLYLKSPSNPDSVLGQAWALINPRLQAAADAINRRATLGAQAISSLTNSYASLIGDTASQAAGFYKPEEKITKAVAGYGRDYLTGSGKTTGAGLDAALAQAGQKGPGDINLVEQGKGAGGAAYGTGIAELDALVSKALAAQTEAALEPGFAQGEGAYQQTLLSAQLARQLADEQSQIVGQIPDIIDTLTQRRIAQAQDARDYAERVREYNLDRQDQLAQQQASIVGPKAPTLAGRIAYWQEEAKKRTEKDPNGYMYYANPKGIGISIRRDPKTGRPEVDPLFTASQQAGLLKSAESQATIRERNAQAQAAQARARASTQNAATAAQREANRHAEAQARIATAQKNARTAAQRAAIQRQAEKERERHNRETERISRMRKAPSSGLGAGSGGTA